VKKQALTVAKQARVEGSTTTTSKLPQTTTTTTTTKLFPKAITIRGCFGDHFIFAYTSPNLILGYVK
jgi:hypothetical protein